MQVLVTGGAGFIGSNLVDALLIDGHSVRVLDDFSTGNKANLSSHGKIVDIIEGDITSLDAVRDAVRDVEVVFHLAAIPSVPKSIQDPIGSNNATVNGTLSILVASRDAGVRRVVFASSSAIYGDQDPSSAKVETMIPRPISPYGVAKLAAEAYCKVFYSVYGLETVALRYFNVFGPRQDPESMYAAVIPRFVTAVLDNRQPTIYGDGEQTRDFTYVGNVVKANMLAAMTPKQNVCGRVFNIAAGGAHSLNTVLDMILEITGKTVIPIYEPARSGDIKHSLANIRSAQHEMKYEVAYTLLDGLKATIDWYQAQDRLETNQ
jgi:UDP-N-acetylglucosamine/UDP-N-acetyl-alpha-D-glucosaminouronate 4-epimerase